MKKNKTIYWTLTVLFALFMGLGAIPDILRMDEAKKVLEHLGYPMYFLQFIGFAKLLGATILLIPIFDKLKEWAYAGLAIDLTGAIYSIIQVDGFGPNILIPSFGILLLIVSYLFCGRIKADAENKLTSL